ncbi:hypothetical protein QF046_002366 [Microbacterium sp. W4I4]|uniref:hypothetical protein n=1 Tax=Microbacterium sp. W4I4 TaxID=3042295 RepID=UPI002789DA13|nr:hypothetical protein [Microbacterium sp. W4I4]MDQ0614725.1 hypothetical protein [Microbacterium sp. W4I4]
MSTLALTNTLAAIFVPIGIAGAAIALICALIMAFALARRAAGLAGGAAGVWIVGALLSWASSFSDVWIPLLVSLGALGAALVVGALLRVLVGGVRRQEIVEPSARTATIQEPRTQPARVAPTQVRPSSPVTDGIRVAA